MLNFLVQLYFILLWIMVDLSCCCDSHVQEQIIELLQLHAAT